MTRKSWSYLWKNNFWMLLCYCIFAVFGLFISSFYLNWIKSDFKLIDYFENENSLNSCDFNRINSFVNEYDETESRSSTLTVHYKRSLNSWYYCDTCRILYINIILFSYIFGVVSQLFLKENKITIPYIQV